MLLLIDKPQGVTSHDVVEKIRNVTGVDKVGHSGTLDPNATGLLVIGVTRAGTKRVGKLQTDTEKTYKATILLGERTDTLDAAGQTVEMTDTDPLPEEEIRETLSAFVGTQEQTPPRHSAVRVNGQRAYKQAREGKDLDIPPRIVEIRDITLKEYVFPNLQIETTVSSGTYIRSLARDIGDRLGCGAYLKKLRRTRVGKFTIEAAHALEEITKDNWQTLTVALK